MNNFTCADCGVAIEKTCNNHWRCSACSRVNLLKTIRKARKAAQDSGFCPNHRKRLLAEGKKKCLQCLASGERLRNERRTKGLCPHHGTAVVSGKKHCQICLDRIAINKLPNALRTAATVRAEETREARTNGTYKCPVWGYTEAELIAMFPSKCSKSVWEFDHIGGKFRNIISGSANRVLKTLNFNQLTLCADYVGRI